ncbi:MAG: hypothetical protein IKT40_12330 [Bacilli bacterium]|nr:hypothetical protein [Bacilli bacterium]
MNKTKYICTKKIKLADTIFGDNRKRVLEFDIFDGFAYCFDEKTKKEYYMTYPRKAFISLSKDMEKSVRDYLELDEHEPIKEVHLLASYNSLHINE